MRAFSFPKWAFSGLHIYFCMVCHQRAKFVAKLWLGIYYLADSPTAHSPNLYHGNHSEQLRASAWGSSYRITEHSSRGFRKTRQPSTRWELSLELLREIINLLFPVHELPCHVLGGYQTSISSACTSCRNCWL
jgi:hypothetical protein